MPKNSLSIIEHVITSPLIRWTWSGLSDPSYISSLVEFRPTDKETARDMICGRYLLAGRLVGTESTSPFLVKEADEQWKRRLNNFSWLRHFSSFGDVSEKEFARILVLDWIGRNKNFNKNSWSPIITSKRVLNWLRHFLMLTEGASDKEIKIISHSLGTQLQSLKIRSKFMKSPIDKIYSAMAMLGSSLVRKNKEKTILSRFSRLQVLLDEQIDENGLHLSRNAFFQFEILSELVSLKQTLIQSNFTHQNQLDRFIKTIDLMYLALDSLTLSTGELAYFNGAGYIPTDLFVALLAKANKEPKKSKIFSGYGILTSNKSTLIADAGIVPNIKFSKNAHASALAFEFSYGSDLIVGNCGACANSNANNNYFRLGKAHNGIVINGFSSAKVIKRGSFANHLKANKKLLEYKNNITMNFDDDETTMSLVNYDFAKKFGIKLQRNFSFLKDEASLIGVDKISAINEKSTSAEIELGFHLAPNSQIFRSETGDVFYITLQSGAKWAFLWEGADASLKKSYRHSNYFGALPIDKIVLNSHFEKSTKEISWIFTKQNN